jgi:hypothetical protein
MTGVRAAQVQLSQLQTGLPGVTWDTTPCNFDPHINIQKIGSLQIKDFPYLPQGGNLNSCGELVKPAPVNGNSNQQWRALGYVLGWHAFQVDNEPKDAVLWLKPTSALGGAIPNELSRDIAYYGGGLALLPFSIFLSLFKGFSWDDSFNFAGNYLDPAAYLDAIESWAIGYGYLHTPAYNGLWHFIDPDSSSGRYNTPPGMCYANGGPDGIPDGSPDFGLLLAGDLGGLSYSTKSSVGHERYGQFDDRSRPTFQWSSPTIADLEFSPADNLAKWGWNTYLAGPTNAKYLGWPLHALGDAAEAQHLANTTGWGHTELEDAIDRSIETALGLATSTNSHTPTDNFMDVQYGSPPSDVTGPNSEYNILQAGYWWWLKYKDGDINIQNMIESAAWQNRQFFDGSGVYFYKVTYSSEDFTNRTYNFNRTFQDVIRPPIENSAGAILALLIRAGQKATPVVDPTAVCATGTSYSPSLGACTSEPDGWCTAAAVVDWSQIPKKCTHEGTSIALNVTANCASAGWFKLKNLQTLTNRGSTGLKIWLSPYGGATGSAKITSTSYNCGDDSQKCEDYFSTLGVYDVSQGSSPIASVPTTYAAWTNAADPCGYSPYVAAPPCDAGVSIVIPNSTSSPIPNTLQVKADQTYDHWDTTFFPGTETILYLQGTLNVEAVGNNYSGCSGSGTIN